MLKNATRRGKAGFTKLFFPLKQFYIQFKNIFEKQPSKDYRSLSSGLI